MRNRTKPKSKRINPVDLEKRVRRLAQAAAFVGAAAIAGLFATGAYDHYTRYSRNNITPVFDDTRSEKLIAATKDRLKQESYIEDVERELRAKDRGKISYLGDVRYDADGSHAKQHVENIARRVGTIVNKSEADKGGTFLTMGNARQMPSKREDIVCYVSPVVFSDSAFRGYEGVNFLTDSDFRHILAFHEAEHAYVETHGIPLPGFLPGDYKRASLNVPPNEIHRIEELWAYRQQLQKMITGEMPTSRKVFEIFAKVYAMEFNNVKQIRDRHVQKNVRELADLVFRAVSDLTPLKEEPWLRYNPKPLK